MAHLYIFTAHHLGNNDSWSILVKPGSNQLSVYCHVSCRCLKVEPGPSNSGHFLVQHMVSECHHGYLGQSEYDKCRMTENVAVLTLHNGLYQTIHGRATCVKLTESKNRVSADK